MEARTGDILGYKIAARDGHLGKVKDLYFDDFAWTIRYVVVETGGRLSGRQVLISPEDVGEPDTEKKVLPVDRTWKEVQDSPSIAERMPISRENELELAKYYGWAFYWQDAPLTSDIGKSVAAEAPKASRKDFENTSHSQLRSIKEVTGYHVHATDEELGSAEDFVVETGNWTISHLVVKSGKWPAHGHVLIPPGWIEHVAWADRTIHVQLTAREAREGSRSSPSSSDRE